MRKLIETTKTKKEYVIEEICDTEKKFICVLEQLTEVSILCVFVCSCLYFCIIVFVCVYLCVFVSFVFVSFFIYVYD